MFTILAFVSRTMGYKKGAHILGVSYDTLNQVTSAIIQGPWNDKDYGSDLIGYMRRREESAAHPAFLPVLTTQLEFTRLHSEFTRLREEKVSNEEMTGLSNLHNRAESGREFCVTEDVVSEVAKFCRFDSTIGKEQEKLRLCLRRLRCIAQFLDDIDENCKDLEEQTEQLRQTASFLENAFTALTYRYAAFHEEVEAQRAHVGFPCQEPTDRAF
jgi:hypothetical protein